MSTAASGSSAKARGTGARRMSDPLPAVPGSVGPQNGAPVRSNRSRACWTVLPMSKQTPVEERCPSCHQRTYRRSWSTASKPRRWMRLSARQRAMEVSSVHSPGWRWNGPPPNMPLTGAKVPGALNSSVVPTASPVASPSSAPR